MSYLTELQSSDLLIHPSFDGSQHEQYYNLPLSQPCPYTENDSNTLENTSNEFISLIYNELGSLPRDTFIQELIQNCKSSNKDIETVRHELFDVVKRQQNFPYPNAILKKRLCPRKLTGDSVESKLGNDCYALYLASVGEFGDDLKNALSVKSSSSSNRTLSCTDEISGSQNDATVNLAVKDTLVRLENDMILLKSEYARDSEMFNRSIEELKKENKQLKDRDFKYSDRFKNLQNQINVIKTCTETFQTDMKTIKVQLQQNCEQNSKTNSDLKSLVSQFLESVKTVTEMKSDIAKIHEHITKHTVNMKSIDKTLKDLDAQVELACQTYSSLSVSVSDVRKRLVNAEKELKTVNKNQKTYSEIVKKVTPLTLVENKQTNKVNETRKINDVNNGNEVNKDNTENKVNEHFCKSTARYVSSQGMNSNDTSCKLNSKPKSTQLDELSNRDSVTTAEIHNTFHDAESAKDHIKNSEDNGNQNILVHFPRSVCNPVHNFTGLIHVERKRVARFYVGGIDKTVSSEQGMRYFLQQSGIRVTFLRYFDKQSFKTASAQLNIDARDEHIIHDSSFWPKGIFTRDWKPWASFIHDKGHA
ncbi:unnamed protein product [Mytilus edulis]|uniref:Uncharacterized protein n=1 Tax=Mytilus edulis TaxID=6550 RepID=A0A8S3TA47_MYTED|nr:unnamed protein product [Mytilus edulis]